MRLKLTQSCKGSTRRERSRALCFVSKGRISGLSLRWRRILTIWSRRLTMRPLSLKRSENSSKRRRPLLKSKPTRETDWRKLRLESLWRIKRRSKAWRNKQLMTWLILQPNVSKRRKIGRKEIARTKKLRTAKTQRSRRNWIWILQLLTSRRNGIGSRRKANCWERKEREKVVKRRRRSD